MDDLEEFGITAEVRGRFFVERCKHFMGAETLEFNSKAEAEAYARGYRDGGNAKSKWGATLDWFNAQLYAQLGEEPPF